MDTLFTPILIMALVTGLFVWLSRRRERSVAELPNPTPQGHTEPVSFDGMDSGVVAEALGAVFQRVSRPQDFLEQAEFQAAVRWLDQNVDEDRELLTYYTGDHMPLACAALETLALRKGDNPEIAEPLLENVGAVHPWSRVFVLRVLEARVPGPLIGRVLLAVGPEWAEFPVALEELRALIRRRMAEGETPSLGEGLKSAPVDQIETLQAVLLKRLDASVAGPLQKEIDEFQDQLIDTSALEEVGSVDGKIDDNHPASNPDIVPHTAMTDLVDELVRRISSNPRRPQVVMGPAGVGKSATISVLVDRIRRDGWIVFRASSSQLLAGTGFVGQLEERVGRLMRNLAAPRKVAWVIPNLGDFLMAGSHLHSRVTILDMIRPNLEAGQLAIIAEADPSGFEAVVRDNPSLGPLFDVQRLEPVPPEVAAELARKWAESRVHIEDPTIDETQRMAAQYLTHLAAPGALFLLLRQTEKRLARDRASTLGQATTSGPASDSGRVSDSGADSVQASSSERVSSPEHMEIRDDDILNTVANLSGLPMQILDNRSSLDLEETERFFSRKVLGQPEAVSCLCDRIAMVKAGVTDPTRPLGVFLFAGPTGTGKTELAKALASYLFRSPDRMVRLDMSEFQTGESLDRLVGQKDGPVATRSLVDQIREQPFSVVLLDEFEKAAPQVWDLFLQLFDDGRLTDSRGRTADFRHAIVILTSNLGAAIPAGQSVGFHGEGSQSFRAGDVERALSETFRAEFLNRIDQVVIFRPLSRAIMRKLLEKELAEAFERRGLRHRQWALEWDDSAIEFLLEKGFTVTLGARPLKRAIERHLLTPLSRTIVEHLYPKGDQFLFVRGKDDRLEVEFIDPDADATDAAYAYSSDTSGDSSSGTHRDASGVAPDGAAVVREPGSRAGTASPGDGPSAPASGLGHESELGDLLSIRALVLRPHLSPKDLPQLERESQQIEERYEAGGYHEIKNDALEQLSRKGFWESPDRFEVLGRIEYLDRVESGIKSLSSILERLARGAVYPGTTETRSALPPELVTSVAQKIHLLRAALDGLVRDEAADAFLSVEAGHDVGAHSSTSGPDEGEVAFSKEVARMYRRWAEHRGMRIDELKSKGNAADRVVFAISGYGAFSLLRNEDGLHVLDHETSSGRPNARQTVRVRVAPRPAASASNSPAEYYERAVSELAGSDTPKVVRRYWKEPSPLVRDLIRGWRTGRIDQVLDGHFDLFDSVDEPTTAHS